MNEFFSPLVANLLLSSLLWIFATWRRDVSLIDLLWPLFFVVAAWIWFTPGVHSGGLQWSVLSLVMAWGARLHIHLAYRNLGHGEDRRYQQIRANNSPGFWWKSYLLVFVLQAVLAWIASWAIFGALNGESYRATPSSQWTLLSVVGVLIALGGLLFEGIADLQLSKFKSLKQNNGQVLDTGLWSLSRHPNYFGECCFWWGIYLVALPNAWWSIASPLLMTLLLLRVSGVTLLESDIHERRPAYREYIQRTPAFIPGFSKWLRRVKP